MAHYLIQVNYPTIVVVGLMIFFLFSNRFLERKSRIFFSVATIGILILAILEVIEYIQGLAEKPSMIRVVVSLLAYSIRPVIIAAVVWLMAAKTKRNYILMITPAIINFVIQLTALFSDIAFSYDEANKFVRGPLGYTAHIVSLYYLILLVVVTMRKYSNLTAVEPFLAVFVSVLILVATVLESVADYYGLINVTAAVTIVFYYMYLNTQQFKRDELTGVFNRRCFNIDANQKFESLNAVIALDLNNLKQINDCFGHEEGDKAILKVTACIRKALIKRCFLYRTGGDEFMILCFDRRKQDIEQMVSNIKTRINKTPYQCAIGIGFAEEGRTVEDLCSVADKKMYTNKMELKKKGSD